MTLPTIIDVAIGLVLMFFILASIGSTLAEFVAAHQKWRHDLLHSTIVRLLEPDITKKFWTHPLILPLFSRTPREIPDAGKTPSATATATAPEVKTETAPKHVAPTKAGWVSAVKRQTKRILSPLKVKTPAAPAYLDSTLFASVVLDLATGEGAVGRLPATVPAWEFAIRTYVPARPGRNNDLQDRLLALLRQVPADSANCGAAFKSAVAKWYDEAMTRTSGEYRRRLQKCLLFIGAGLAIVFNCDALRIANVLYQSPTLRAQVAQQAETLVKEEKPTAAQTTTVADDAGLKDQLKHDVGQLRDLTKIGFPIGWSPVWRDNFILKPAPEDTSTATDKSRTATSTKPAIQSETEANSSWLPEWPGKLWHFAASTVGVVIEPGLTAYLAKFAGLFATALAVCLGAPFWFDLLGKLVKMRSSAGSDAEKKKTDTGPSTAGASASAGSPAQAASAATATGAMSPSPLPAAIEALSHPGADFSTARAYWLAEFADHAYETIQADLDRWLKLNGFTLVESFDAAGTQGFLAQGEGVVVLAFRGTEQKLADFVTDAEFQLVDGAASGVPGRVHIGFSKALAVVAQRLDAVAARLKDRRVLFHITGHSLGGALATLAALRLGRTQQACPIQTVHTFGSPRVGDETFVQAFDTLFKGRSYRFVNDEDLVTRIPPRVGHYDHVGEIIYIDEAGRLQRDIGYWYRFLNFVTNALEDLKKAVQTTVKDHSMKLYCGHLEKAARSTSDRT